MLILLIKISKYVRFIKVNSFPSIPEHLTAKTYVDQALSNGVDEP